MNIKIFETIPRVNIGMVGHVSNGKTTFVDRLTGIDTKKYHEEKKRGMTIKLGYANLLLWICDQCDSVFATNQKKQKVNCETCKTQLCPSIQISLSDCPGHHSLVSTMIKGSSIIDGAIVVTDVRKKELQIQTLEHLAILEGLGIREVLVVQNKCDLVKKLGCMDHYDMLRDQLKGTIAENAPIIPICAQQGFQMDLVVKYLYYMCQRLVQNNTEEKKNNSSLRSDEHPCVKHGFAIIRTFDINKQYSDIDVLKGGVIGGCVVGNETYRNGEDIEIRPGYIDAKTKQARPLRTRILSMFSENLQVPFISKGGLFALGTTLDPVLTKSDALVGCLAGRPEELPEIRTELQMKVFTLKRGFMCEKLPKLAEGKVYLFVLGNLVIQGRITKCQQKVITVQLERPICTYMEKCIIYSKIDQSLKMIALGTLTTEK